MSNMNRPGSLNQSLADVKYEQYINNLHDRLPSLIDPSDIDCNRWPWELVQNAKDTVVHRTPENRFVDITFRYFKDSNDNRKLCFKHNGAQFSDKAITGLIWKFSAEKRNEQTTEDGLTRDKQSTGRFGTGFMTTHALSLTVDIEGSMYNADKGVERNVSVNFTLHREGPTDEKYKEGVQRTENEMEFDKTPIPIGEELPTKFTYHLKDDSGIKAAEMGLANVRLNAAQTMLFCPTVRSITVIDEINQKRFNIIRSNADDTKGQVKVTTFTEKSSDCQDDNIRKFVSLEIEEYSPILSKYWQKNRNLRLHIGVEVDKENTILPIPISSPSIYCSLPLTGFEKMLLPFYINSNDFEPATERTSLYLFKKETKMVYNQEKNEDEEQVIQNGVNWSILRRSVSLYETLVDYLIKKGYSNRYNLIRGLNQTLKGAWSDEEKNCLASRFILPLRKMLVNKDLVKTSNGYCSISNNVKFLECPKDKNRSALYEICSAIFPKDLPLECENQQWVDQKWGKYSFSSDFDEKLSEDQNPSFPIVDYNTIAQYIEDAGSIEQLELHDGVNKLNWLNNFYKWIAEAKYSTLAEKSIVPNRKGKFCSCETGCQLKDASEISSNIFDFLKKINIDWDDKLLMEGIENVVLDKETTDNITTAVKERTNKIIDTEKDILEKLLPILLALPANNNDGRTVEFYNKRTKIIEIIKTMYPSKINEKEYISLDLKSETWKSADDWLMSFVAKEIAKRKKLDIHDTSMTEEEMATLFCTPNWLSDIVNFMFEKSYLHLDDITENEAKNDTICIIPNRYGDFMPINKLYNQGCIPSELLDDCLNSTGFDIKEVIIYDGFKLNDKINISDFSISILASKYNEFFDEEKCNNKEVVADYLLHLIPECGDQFIEIRELYDEYYGKKNVPTKTIQTSDLNIWKGAKEYMIGLLASLASNCNSIEAIGQQLSNNNNDTVIIGDTKKQYAKIGLEWLNRLTCVINNDKITLDENLNLVPDWYGILHPNREMIYNGSILNKYNRIDTLINIKEGKLWSHYPDEQKEEDYDEIISKIVYSDFISVNEYQDNTDEKLFRIIDKLISYCRDNNNISWKPLLKESIDTLIKFFDNNSTFHIWGLNPKWTQFFPTTYNARKELYYDFICDAETKMRIARINDNFTPDEIDNLISQREVVKDLLNRKEHYKQLEQENKALQEKIEELRQIHSLLGNCPTEKFDEIKNFINDFTIKDASIKDGETPLGEDDKKDILVVPKTYEIEVESYDGRIQRITTDQEQYAGLSLEEIERYVSEAKGAVVKYFRELDEKHNLGLKFDEKKIAKHSFSQLYGISDKNGNEIPIVVHSYKGPQYRYFDLNWYDWQLLSKNGSMLFVLTVTGLQCIPLYALPVRNFNFSIKNEMPNETKATLLTLASVGKCYSDLSFDFGNNMPHGFINPIPFDYVPEELNKCISSIKGVCDQNIPQIADVYNYGKNIPLIRSTVGYSSIMKEYEETGNMRDIFDAPANNIVAPSVGTSFID